MNAARALPCLLLGFAVACSGDDVDPPSDGGVGGDAGVVADDAGAPDAGMATICPAPGPILQAGVAPPKRGDSVMAWDPDCQRLVVFFGDAAEPQNCGSVASEFLVEGYVYEPTTNQWAEIAVSGQDAPLPRARADAVWDTQRKRLVLFGGRFRNGTQGAYQYPADVWAFDFESLSWERLHDGSGEAPQGRMNTVLALDPTRDVMVLHGGGQIRADFSGYNVDDETWIFDLATNTWRPIEPAIAPDKRLFHMGAMDEQRGRLYVFGGAQEDAFTTTSFLRDIWYLDLESETWTDATPGGDNPLGRIKGELAYDGARDRLVLFAGHDDGRLGNDNDVWTYDLAAGTWASAVVGDTFNAPAFGTCDFPADFANVDLATPERRESHVFVIAGDQAYMYGGRTDCGLASDTWSLDLESMTWEELIPSFTGMTCYRSGRTDCDEPEARKCG